MAGFPTFRLPRAVLAFALLALVVAATFWSAPARAGGTGSAASLQAVAALDLGVLDRMNQIRVAHGLHPLAASSSLGSAALAHSQDMVANGYFAHESADGSPFSKRVQGFYPVGGFRYWSAGENLFWASGAATPAETVAAWMASPGHRANILDPAWRQAGVGAVVADSAPGTYGGSPVTVITTDFGVRR